MFGLAVALLAAGLVSGSAFTQAPPRSGEAADATTIRTTTRLVLLHVEAADHAGNPVHDLTKDDFRVFDNREPQAVQIFRLENVDSETTSDTGEEASRPGTFTNQRKRSGRELRIIVVDPAGFGTWNPGSFDYENAWHFVRKILAGTGPDNAVAVYEFADKLLVRHDFSDPYETLPRTIPITLEQRASVDLVDSSLSAEQGNPEPIKLPGFALARPRKPAGSRTKNFEQLVQHLAGIPGRKRVLYVGGPLPFSPMSQSFERIKRMLNDADIALYTVDARVPIGDGTIPAAYTGNWNSWILAADTGGEPFMPKDPSAAARRAWQRPPAQYVIGYYPRHNRWNGEYRVLSVTVGRPGVKISYRRGYYAGGRPMSSSDERNTLLQSIAYSPTEATGLPVRVEAYTVNQKRAVRLTVLLRPQDVSFGTRDSRATLDVLYQEQNKDIEPLSSKVETIEIPAARLLAKPRFLGIQRELKVATRAEQVRIIVRDRNSGAVGSVYIPLEHIPAR